MERGALVRDPGNFNHFYWGNNSLIVPIFAETARAK